MYQCDITSCLVPRTIYTLCELHCTAVDLCRRILEKISIGLVLTGASFICFLETYIPFKIRELDWDFNYTPLSIQNPSTNGDLLRIRMQLVPKLTLLLWTLSGIETSAMPYVEATLFQDSKALPAPAKLLVGIPLIDLSKETGPEAPKPPAIVEAGKDSIIISIEPPVSSYPITGYQVSHSKQERNILPQYIGLDW